VEKNPNGNAGCQDMGSEVWSSHHHWGFLVGRLMINVEMTIPIIPFYGKNQPCNLLLAQKRSKKVQKWLEGQFYTYTMLYS
jgi:hypothetical protein